MADPAPKSVGENRDPNLIDAARPSSTAHQLGDWISRQIFAYRWWLRGAAALAFTAACLDFLFTSPQEREILRDAVLLFLSTSALWISFHHPHALKQPQPSLVQGLAFRGLLPFQETDRHRFFGRDTDRLALLERITLRDFRFGILYGDSGCGKTSLIQAGLLPGLRDQGYLTVYCRSYNEPLTALVEDCRRRNLSEARQQESATDYLCRTASELGAGLVIVCDQFEEFFLRGRFAPERDRFLSFVSSCVADKHLPIKLLFSLRSDFLYLFSSELSGRIEEPLLSSRLYHLRNLDPDRAIDVIER